MNSKECLKHAQECIEQANGAQSEEAQVELLRVGMAWLQLAEEIGRLEVETGHGAMITRAAN